MIYGQAIEGVDANREPLQAKASQKEETSEPSELGSIFGNRVTKSADVYGDGCVHFRWTSSSESCGSQGLGGRDAAAMSRVTSLQCLTPGMHIDTTRV